MTKKPRKITERRLNALISKLGRPTAEEIASAFTEALILGDAFMRVHSDGTIEHLKRSIGFCECGKKRGP